MNSSRGDLRQRVKLNDLIRYLITSSRQNGLMRVREDWLNPLIFHQIEQIWPEGPALLISHLVYAGHYYCSSGLKFIKTIEDEVKNASKLEGDRRNLIRCKWPFVLLDRLISERKSWIRKSLKMAYLPSRIHTLASETYSLEKEISRDEYQEDVSHSFMSNENSPKRLSSLAGKISPLVGLEFGLDSSVILDHDLKNHEAVEKLWKVRYIAFSQILMGYVAQIISLVDVDQLTMWTKSIQMGSKEMAIGLNKITVSFVYKLLKLPDSVTRAKVIIFLIEAATYCYQKKDHTTSFLIASSLENNTIQRLKESWKLVPPRYLDQIKTISRNLGIDPYDNFVGYFKRIYPNEETSLAEIGLINMVGFLSRIERLKECRPLIDRPIILSKLRSNGNLLLPLYQWSADNQLNRYFQMQKLSDSDQKAIILFASPYANLTERMISDYMSIKEKYSSIRTFKPRSPRELVPRTSSQCKALEPEPKISNPTISENLINLSLGNLKISLGQDSKEISSDKPIIKSYPSFHLTKTSTSTIVLDLKRPPQVPIKNKDKLLKEAIKGDIIKEGQIKTEVISEETAKEEVIKEETAKEEVIKEEAIKEEVIKEEVIKEEAIKEEVIKEEIAKEEPAKKEVFTGMVGALFVTHEISTTENSTISPSIPSRPAPIAGEKVDISDHTDDPTISTFSPVVTEQAIEGHLPIVTLPQSPLIDILSLGSSSRNKNVEVIISPRCEELPEIKEENNIEMSTPSVETNKRRSVLFRIFIPKRLSLKWRIRKKNKKK